MGDNDVTNFSTSSSSHRLPTVSASVALEDVISLTASPIETGLPSLDEWLVSSDAYNALPSYAGDQPSRQGVGGGGGGLQRGLVTEIYGPPGSGKTALAMQISANGLCQDPNAHVCWIDTASPMPATRLEQILQQKLLQVSPDEPPSSPPPVVVSTSSKTETDRNLASVLSRLRHLHIFTVPHLLALLLHPFPGFPPPSTTVIVIDNISSLFSTAFLSASSSQRTTAAVSARKSAILSTVSTALSRLAKVNNLAVLVVNQTATTAARTGPLGSGGGRKAAGPLGLKPSVGGQEWNIGVGTRCGIYREFLSPDVTPWHTEEEGGGGGGGARAKRSCRWIEVMKGGRKAEHGMRRRVAFWINDTAVNEVHFATPGSDDDVKPLAPSDISSRATAAAKTPPTAAGPVPANPGFPQEIPQPRPPKRKRKASSELEIADSQSSSSSPEPDRFQSARTAPSTHVLDEQQQQPQPVAMHDDDDDDEEYGSFLVGDEDFDFDFEDLVEEGGVDGVAAVRDDENDDDNDDDNNGGANDINANDGERNDGR